MKETEKSEFTSIEKAVSCSEKQTSSIGVPFLTSLKAADNNPENETDKGPDNSGGGNSTFQKKFDSVLAELLKGPILLPSHEAKLPT